MATSLGSFDTRIQLKSDTEANWIAHPIVPLLGELIIYSADNTHSYTRLKVGDGNTSTTNLPFIDAGTINGRVLPQDAVVTYANTDLFPQPGVQNVLYIDLSSNIIYCYTPSSGYTQLSNFTYNIEKTNVSLITSWNSGNQTKLECNQGILEVTTGTLPYLKSSTLSVVSNITKVIKEVT